MHAPNSLEQLYYQVDLAEHVRHLAKITLMIPQSGQTKIELAFPVWTPGSYLVRDYSRNIETMAAFFQSSAEELPAQNKAINLERIGKNRWVANLMAGSGWLMVNYWLYCCENSVRTNWLNHEYGFLTGAATFPWIVGRTDQPIAVSLLLPECWHDVGTSLQLVNQLGQQREYQADNFDQLVDSPIACGNLQVTSFVSGKRQHFLVNVGGDDCWDWERAAGDVQKIVAKQQEFWRDVPYTSYWFLNLCTQTFGGLEHDNSTVLMCHRFAMRQRDTYVDWLALVSHEFFHTWNVRRLRPKALMQYDYESEQYVQELWIAEGITSYYDDLFIVRSGLCSPDEYLARLSKNIQAVQSAPGRLIQDLVNSSWDAWVKHYRPDENSQNSRISYYLKGCLVAWLLDAQLRASSEQSVSLDDIMRRLWEEHSPCGYTLADFTQIVCQLGNPTIATWLDQTVRSPSELDYTPALSHFGLRFKTADLTGDAVSKASAMLGCDTEFVHGCLMVKRVRRDSSADLAGLNCDDEVIAINGYRVTPNQWPKLLELIESNDSLNLTISRSGRIGQASLTLPLPSSTSWQLEFVKSDSSTVQHWLG